MSLPEIYLQSDNLVKILGLLDEDEAYVNDAVITMTLCKETVLALDSQVALLITSGSDEPTVGDVLEGVTDGAFGIYVSTQILGGTWAGNDVTGYITMTSQKGTWNASETIKNVTQNLANIATTGAVSTGGRSITDSGDAKTKLAILGHGLSSSDYIKIVGSRLYNGEFPIDSIVDSQHFIIDEAFVLEFFTGDEVVYVGIENGTNISLDYIAASNGNYEGYLPDTLLKMVEGDWYYLFIDIFEPTNSVRLTYALKWNAVYKKEA